jgi:hypothetical protein
LRDILNIDERYQDNRYRTEALSFDWNNTVFLADNINGEKRVFIEFDKAEIMGYLPIQVNGLDIKVSENNQISNSMLYLCIALADLQLEEAFLAFTSSIVLTIQKSTSNLETIKIIEEIIKRYTDFFSRKSTYSLSEIQEQGLFAELFELSNLINIYGEKAIKSWEGPEKRRRDFIFNDFEIEVKSTMKLSDTVTTVTSIKQLEPFDMPLYLHLHALEKSNTGIQIIDIIDRIIEKISSIQYKKMFLGKLFLLGIDKDTYEPKQSYRVVSSTKYVVDDSFPRIKSENIPVEVFEIKYKIDLKSIKGEMLNYD